MLSTKTWLLLLLLSAAPGDGADRRVTAGPPKLEGEMAAGEGPSWDPAGYLYFVGQERISRRSINGKVEIYRDHVAGPNGSLVDPEGRLLVTEAGARRVTRTERDGSITVLAERYEGKRFNSPNDLALDSKGRIYFTDPRYGRRDTMEMQIEGVYRIEGPQSVTRILGAPDIDRPNGILVSPDDRYLYVADNNNNTVGGARKLWRFDLKVDGSVDPGSRKLIFDWRNARGPDGLKMDSKGLLYVAAGLNKPNPPAETADEFKGGIYVLSPAGELVEFIPIPKDEVTNCAFGGRDLKTLFVTAGGSLWSVRVKTAGLVSSVVERK
jgi:gluconolactonase